MDLVLYALSSSTGKSERIDELETADEEKEIVSFLIDDGFSHYTKSSTTLEQMMREAIRGTLARALVSAAHIDGVMGCSESFWDDSLPGTSDCAIDGSDGLRERRSKNLFDSLGFLRAARYANWMCACSNFAFTLKLASRLIVTNEHANMLVVFSERVPPLVSRVMPNGASVLSDCSVSFLLGTDRPGYSIRSIVTHMAPQLVALYGEGNPQLRLLQLVSELTIFKAKIDRGGSNVIGDCDLILVDSLNSRFLEIVCNGLCLDPKRLVSPLKHRMAHAFSMDAPVALENLELAGKTEPGMKIAILNIGPWAFGLVVVEVLDRSVL